MSALPPLSEESSCVLCSQVAALSSLSGNIALRSPGCGAVKMIHASSPQGLHSQGGEAH